MAEPSDVERAKERLSGWARIHPDQQADVDIVLSDHDRLTRGLREAQEKAAKWERIAENVGYSRAQAQNEAQTLRDRVADLRAKHAAALEQLTQISMELPNAGGICGDSVFGQAKAAVVYVSELRDEVADLRSKLEILLNQNQEIAASNADHIRWHREAEARLAELQREVESANESWKLARGGQQNCLLALRRAKQDIGRLMAERQVLFAGQAKLQLENERLRAEMLRYRFNADELGQKLDKAEAALAAERCECGQTGIHHHCGLMGFDPMQDAPCPGCRRP